MDIRIDYLTYTEQVNISNDSTDKAAWKSLYSFICDYLPNVVYVDAASESNIPENVSEEIKEALVSYRTKTYKLNRIKAYELFKNVSCDRIAKFAPTSLEELKALRCLDEAQITLYGQDIIEIVKQVLNK